MTTAFNIIKILGCWICIILAVGLLVLGHQPFGMAGVLAMIAIAFALAPVGG